MIKTFSNSHKQGKAALEKTNSNNQREKFAKKRTAEKLIEIEA